MSAVGNGAPRPRLAPKTTTFDRIWHKIEAQACGTDKPYTPRAAARLYLMAERASGDATSETSLAQLGDVASSRLERIAETRSCNVGDVAAKLAALIVESAQDWRMSGGIPAAIHSGLCSCLADLTILGERPLPDVSAVLGMEEADFELRDATEDEIGEFQAEARAENGAQVAPLSPEPDIATAADLDPTWPVGLDLRNLRADLEGVIGCLSGLDDLAEAGAELKPEYLRPALAMLVAWRDRARASRDLVEAEEDARREAQG